MPAPAPSVTPAAEGPTLEEAVADHLRAVKRQSNPTEKELRQRESHLAALVDAFGKDRRLVRITRQDAGKFFKAMQEMPTHADTRKALGGLSFFARSARTKDLELPAMHGRTVNSYVGDARGLFADAVKEGLLDRNPFDGMSVREQGFTENEAKPWKPHQQSTFFALPLFHGCKSDRAVFEPGAHLLNDWRFWTPLIAATAGARVGEIAQLRPEDVRSEDGIWFFDISSEGGRRIKNRASKRRTPIHSQLLRMGLTQLAEARLKAGAERLLPSVPAPINGSASQALTA